jgi:glutathione S-transferase
VRVILYWMAVSHPSQVARKMLELKNVEFEVVDVLPLGQRVHLRLAGFRWGTVPALKLDGHKLQGSRRISRALDQVWPDPPLFPSDPAQRERVIEAERWGDEALQPVPRRIARYAAARNREMRRSVAASQSLPAPGLVAALSAPVARYYAGSLEVDGRRGNEAGVRADLAAIPELLDHADRLLADGTLAIDPPNAATLQVLSSVRLLCALDDLRELVSETSAKAAYELFPNYPVHIPTFLPRDWLPQRS